MTHVSHPERCRGCRGSGYVPGPRITETVQGRQLEYLTVKPCEHDHWNDDPHEYDPYRDKPLSQDDPAAVEARGRGIAIGRHELWERSGGALGEQHPNDRQKDEVA